MQGAGLVLTSYENALRRSMDIVANNIANVNTTGYKRESVAFDTYLSKPTPTDSFQFAVDSGTYRDATQGSTLVTGNDLDVAIMGQGYFAVQTAGGIRYTRAGAFMLDAGGNIVTPTGDKVLGDGNQPIVLPDDATDILIAPDGTVSAMTGGATDAAQFGKIEVVKFKNELSLQPIGDNMYAAEETPQPDTDSRLVQGSIEQSNVQSIAEMTRMIDISRNYQQVVHLLDLEYQRQASAIQRLGRISA